MSEMFCAHVIAKGIFFLNSRDIFPIMQHPEVFGDLITLLTEHIEENYKNVDAIVGLESRGFIIGPIIAQKLGISFVPARKKGKLPGECYSATYSLEYGKVQFSKYFTSFSQHQNYYKMLYYI